MQLIVRQESNEPDSVFDDFECVVFSIAAGDEWEVRPSDEGGLIIRKLGATTALLIEPAGANAVRVRGEWPARWT